jgi:hypothetical protein
MNWAAMIVAAIVGTDGDTEAGFGGGKNTQWWRPGVNLSKDTKAPSRREPKICPECDHVFLGNGWDGIDAHWKARHVVAILAGIAAALMTWNLLSPVIQPIIPD